MTHRTTKRILAATLVALAVTASAVAKPCNDGCRKPPTGSGGTRNALNNVNSDIRKLQDQITRYTDLSNRNDIVYVPNILGVVKAYQKDVFARKLAERLRQKQLDGKKIDVKELTKSIQALAQFSHTYRRRLKTKLLPSLQKDLQNAQQAKERLTNKLKNAR